MLKREIKENQKRNKEFARITYAFVGLFICMMGYIAYFNIAKSDDYINSPYNARQDVMASQVVRGKILDSTGNVLAETVVNDDGSETRRYPYNRLYAHVVGYDTKGKSGLESSENFNLLTSNTFFLSKIKNELQNEKSTGDNVVTTLNTAMQQAAFDALGDNKGAVVVLEPSTGKILTMVSKPAYNPNDIEANWESLNNNTDSILLNRATQGAYPPGSTFKIVSALEYIRENPSYNNYSYVCEGSITRSGTTINCIRNSVHGTQNLQESFAHSCNASFSNIGLNLNLAAYKSTAEDLLFNKNLPGSMAARKSSFVLQDGDGDAAVMMTAIGQGETLVSPYHMALVTAAIANGGKLMTPYLVDHIENASGTIVSRNSPSAYGDLMTSQEASQLTSYMEAVVKNGTATDLNGQSYTVAGKTGTAEYSSDKDKSHSWFVGFTNIDNPDLAISVVVEGSDGGTRAVSVAKSVLNAYY